MRMLKLVKLSRGRMAVCGCVFLIYFIVMSSLGLGLRMDYNFRGAAKTKLILSPKENGVHSLLDLEGKSPTLREISQLMANNIGQVIKGNNVRRYLHLQNTGTDSKKGTRTHGILPDFCQNLGFDKKPAMDYDKSTIIISLIHLSWVESIYLLSRMLLHIPGEFTEDIIVTAENKLDVKSKDKLEKAVDLCPICRLLFLEGTIYKHRNSAARFANSPILVFVDARVELTKNWLPPLIFELTFNPGSVVSPHLRLRREGTDVISEGYTRLGMTWDLEVVRIPLTPEQTSMVQKQRTLTVNQTAILKEVLAIRKSQFIDLDGFDVIPSWWGGEHASFSMKVINCRGEILTSLCSQIFLDVPAVTKVRKSPRDYISPSFHTLELSNNKYYESIATLWLDSYSFNLFKSSLHRKLTPSNSSSYVPVSSGSRRGVYSTTQNRFVRLLKSKMKAAECDVTNLRYVLMKYQPRLLTLNGKTKQQGYIRSLDGIYALGVNLSKLPPVQMLDYQTGGANDFQERLLTFKKGFEHSNKWPSLEFTRNASQWLGPLSYTEGAIHYNRIWCLTLIIGLNDGQKKKRSSINIGNDVELQLQPCRRGVTSQIFVFNDNILRWSGEGGKKCIVLSNETTGTTRGFVMSSCSNLDRARVLNTKDGHFFKIDFEKI